MVTLAAGTLPAGRYVDIWPLDELRGITVTDQAVELGALTTYTEIRQHAQLMTEFPLLGLAAKETGAIAIQNRGTIGGNIANASPAADTPPALLAYDAELELTSLSGVRTVAYSQFHSGYKQMDRRPGELITKVRLRRPPSDAPGRTVHYYRKVGTRAAQAISKVCLAAFARIDGARLLNIRLGLGSVAPIPLRCTRTESVLLSGPAGRSPDPSRRSHPGLRVQPHRRCPLDQRLPPPRHPKPAARAAAAVPKRSTRVTLGGEPGVGVGCGDDASRGTSQT
jgi:CO/xanthine dehydrogenase FAD-binding subunit